MTGREPSRVYLQRGVGVQRRLGVQKRVGTNSVREFLICGSLLIGLLLASTAMARLEVSAQDRGQDAFRPLTQAMLNDPDPSDWLMWRGGYANWGYSPLDQITPDNVNELRLAWSWSFAPAGPGSTGMQVEPIVYDGVMYILK